MSYLEDRLNGHLSSLFQTKHPDFIPQISNLLPKSPNLWELIGREVLTPFAPKFRIYNFEKHIPQLPRHARKSILFSQNKVATETQIFDDSQYANSSESILSHVTPKSSKSPKIISRKSFRETSVSYNRHEDYRQVKRKNEAQEVNIQRLIFKKSHSIDLEKSVDIFAENHEEKKKITGGSKSKLEKLKSFTFSKSKANLPSFNVSRNLAFSSKEVFRKKSCRCRFCGRSGKLENMAIILEKHRIPGTQIIKKEGLLAPPIKVSQKQSSFTNLPKHNSLKIEEKERSLKEIRFQEVVKSRMSVATNLIKLIKANAEKPPSHQSSLESFASSMTPLNPLKTPVTKIRIPEKRSYFAKKKLYPGPGSRTERNSLYLNEPSWGRKSILKNFSSHNEATTDRSHWTTTNNDDSSLLDLSEIVYMNGSFRTKQFMKKQLGNIQEAITQETRKASPYFAGLFQKTVQKLKIKK